MIKKIILKKIQQLFPFEPTEEQLSTLELLSEFITSNEPDRLFLLKGYAGTGKTTMLGTTVKTLDIMRQKSILLAPTGRAAKVFSEYAGHKAFTIHKKIYRQKSLTADSAEFSLSENLHKDTLFIVDEASMISNESPGIVVFGSGCLLDDLIQYVYSGENCKLVLIGDSAQLPPVFLTASPALNAGFLEGYNLKVTEVQLTQVVRQHENSGILYNATKIRKALNYGMTNMFPLIRTDSFADIKRITGNDLIEEIASAYDRDGIDDTVIICRSNKHANRYNNGIRNRILYREEEVSSGDRLMIVKNNYFWGETHEGFDFLANGEIVEVLRVRHTEEMHGFHFCNVLIRFIDHDTEIELKIMLETLQSESPALSKECNDRLFASVARDYEEIGNKRDRLKKIKNDIYFNALQVKYAYALTCHKSQGGQWNNVFLDIGYVNENMMGTEFYRWLYTAFTRAKKHLYLINWKPAKKN